ncbi:ATP-binding cassette domain-containing protein [Schaalia hyovaginalis]|uniref:ABC-type sugar transport system ATPase subunit n=1 Tax=Schaalia hyovaginalis TaxID=29316 RepID=A0A923E548_9ACTO|nr:ABC-type sugar transport system ATPase subunit [Schaalia hyovaginalis]
MDNSEILRVEELHQKYPGVHAVKGVTLTIQEGMVLGLVGENGAGKSTLIKMLGGIERPYSGRIVVRDAEVQFGSSSDSQAAGIAVVSQEFMLVPDLSIADNIFLGHELTQGPFVKSATTLKEARELLKQLGLELDPNRLVSTLTVGDQQLVEIARALSYDFSVIIMDEPSAALNDAEIANLHVIVRRLAKAGKAVIYVSHHLDEIFEICSNVAVMRDGALVAEVRPSDISQDELIEAMLGRKPEKFSREAKLDSGAVFALQVQDVLLPGNANRHNFKLRNGEILGLAGLVGSGRSEMTRALFGAIPIIAGSVIVGGKNVRIRDSRSAIRNGIFMLSEDRKAEGIFPHLSVLENALVSKDRKNLKSVGRYLPIGAMESGAFGKLRESMRIRVANSRQLIASLSGGNQQKVLLGRALLSGCPILILNEPTRGVDVGAKVEIYQLIKELADRGVSVIISSSDAPELAAICDRCLVYFSGKIISEISGADNTEEAIIAAAVGQGMEGGDVE